VWTKEHLDYAAEVLTQVQAQINEGGQVLLEALLTGDTEKLDAILDSLVPFFPFFDQLFLQFQLIRCEL